MEIRNFVLDFCRASGGVVDPPAYGVYDVLLPDRVAAELGAAPFLRLAFDDGARGDDLTLLSYGHPLVESMAEVARESPACAHFFINDVRLDKTGLAALARAGLSFPNAALAEAPRAVERRVLCHYVRFNFKAALITDEKRELLTSVALDTHTGAVVHHLEAAAYQLSDSRTFAPLPDLPALWAAGAPPLSAQALHSLLDRATRAAAGVLAPTLSPLRTRAARLLELDRARLEAYYSGLERDLERRLKRTEDQTRRANLEDKLAATQADRAAKLADAEARYRLRVELELINIAVISQPKVALQVQIENRQASVARDALWDPLRHQIEPLVCDVCTRPQVKLYLCANNHLACGDCLAPQCVDCKRAYCRACAAEVTTCAVCGRPVCQKSLTRCRECGKGTCREHVTLCHAPAPAPAPPSPTPTPPPPEPAPAPAPGAPPDSAPAKPSRQKSAKPAARPQKRPVEDPGHRLYVQIEPAEPLIVAFINSKGGKEVAQRIWELTDEGIAVTCHCEKGWACPMARTTLQAAPASGIEAQLEAEINKLRVEYRIPVYRTSLNVMQGGRIIRLPKLRLRGKWKEER